MKRLREFYKRFGFAENKGRNKDFNTQEAMIREPQSGRKYHAAAAVPRGHARQQRVTTSFAGTRAFLKTLSRRAFKNRDRCLVASVSMSTSAKKMMSGKAVGKSDTTRLHLLVASNVDTLFEDAIYGWAATYDGKSQDVGQVHRLFAIVHLPSGKAALAKVSVKETVNPKDNNPL